MGYPDSDAWVQLSLDLQARERKTFGEFDAASRFTEWKREFDGYVAKNNLPALSMVRLPRDHTQGTARGYSAPRAMVADNDYALGEIVDTVSHSPYWRDTVICILEDDSQSGHDHVDCHRIPALIISPYVKPGLVQSHFYNTVSMIRTIELMLGIDPMNQYDAFADPIDVFDSQPRNLNVYSAILPQAGVLSEANTPSSYRSQESARILSPLGEETESDLKLNDILWGATMGSMRPTTAKARSDDD
jgi:hypothetical protein